MKLVTEFLEEPEMEISPEKSTTTLFTPSTHEAKTKPELCQGCSGRTGEEPETVGRRLRHYVLFWTTHNPYSDQSQTQVECTKGPSWFYLGTRKGSDHKHKQVYLLQRPGVWLSNMGPGHKANTLG